MHHYKTNPPTHSHPAAPNHRFIQNRWFKAYGVIPYCVLGDEGTRVYSTTMMRVSEAQLASERATHDENRRKAQANRAGRANDGGRRDTGDHRANRGRKRTRSSQNRPAPLSHVPDVPSPYTLDREPGDHFTNPITPPSQQLPPPPPQALPPPPPQAPPPPAFPQPAHPTPSPAELLALFNAIMSNYGKPPGGA